MTTTKKMNAGVLMLILLICNITTSYSQLKIAAVLGDVAAMLNVTMTQAALLMTLFTATGLVLAIPGAALMSKTGKKNMLIAVMLCLVLGNVIGALSNSFFVIMISRVIEGVAGAMIATIGIAMFNEWLSGSAIGTATGVLNSGPAIGSFLTMNVALMILSATGNLKSLWWVGAAVAALCVVITVIFIKDDKKAGENGGAIATEKVSIGEAFQNKAFLLTCITMFSMAFVLFGFVTCYPQIFEFYGLSKETANFYASINGISGAPACILAGIIIGKAGKPFTAMIIGAAASVALCFAVPYLGDSTFILHAVLVSVFTGGLSMTSIYIYTPQLAAKPQLIGVSMGVLAVSFGLGVAACTPVLTALSQNNTTWTVPSLVLTAASAVMLISAVMAKGIHEKKKVA